MIMSIHNNILNVNINTFYNLFESVKAHHKAYFIKLIFYVVFVTTLHPGESANKRLQVITLTVLKE